MAKAAADKNAWDRVECPWCQRDFTVAHAVDEMFLRGSADGYAKWAGTSVAHFSLECKPGAVALIPLHGRFVDVYRILWGSIGGISCLAGGIGTKYVQQGYAMISVAPDPTTIADPDRPLNLLVTIIGQSEDDPPIEPWKELFLEARLGAVESTRLAPILVVAALDLYFEDRTNEALSGPRPDRWDRAVHARFGKRLRDMMGEAYSHLEISVTARNDLAHGRDHLNRLPDELARREGDWLERGRYYEGEGAISPVSKLSLSAGLAAIRCVQQLSEA